MDCLSVNAIEPNDPSDNVYEPPSACVEVCNRERFHVADTEDRPRGNAARKDRRLRILSIGAGKCFDWLSVLRRDEHGATGRLHTLEEIVVRCSVHIDRRMGRYRRRR